MKSHMAQMLMIYLLCLEIIDKRHKSVQPNCFHNDKYRKWTYTIMCISFFASFGAGYGFYYLVFGEENKLGSLIFGHCLSHGLASLLTNPFAVIPMILLYIIALVAIVVIAVLTTMGDKIKTVFQSVIDAL